MGSAVRFCLNIVLIAVIGVLLWVVTLYFPDYNSNDFSSEQLPWVLTGLFFLAAFLNPKGSCQKAEIIIGCIGVVISYFCYALSTISWGH